MAAEDPLLLLVALAFAPALFYLVGLALRHPGPSFTSGLVGFVYGATMSIAVLGLLYVAFAAFVGDPTSRVSDFFAQRGVAGAREKDFVLVVVMAPLLEEAAKGIGVWLLGWRLASGRDGAYLGAAVGLGFAAIETFLYLLAALAEAGSFAAVFTVALVRSISAALLHPSATGLTGYGIARSRLQGTPVLLGALPYYGFAVLLHAAYNYLAGFLPPQDVGGFTLEVNLLAAIVLASIAWGSLKRRVAARA